MDGVVTRDSTHMRIVFRVDSSANIGTGHVRRCLTLAKKLGERGAECIFICRPANGDIRCIIERLGFSVVLLPETVAADAANAASGRRHLIYAWNDDAEATVDILSRLAGDVDWLIVDHYALDQRWEQRLRDKVGKIMVIDDLANRRHECDVLLNQDALLNDHKMLCEKIVPKHCRMFLGPEYLLLRDDFREIHKNIRKRTGTVKRMIVSFGGFDETNETEKVLKAIRMINMTSIRVDITAGTEHRRFNKLKKLADGMPHVRLLGNIMNVAELMNNSDLAVGAGGMMNWERCYLGLPSLVTITADNQDRLMSDLKKLGAIILVGKAQDLSVDDYKEAIETIVFKPARCKSLARKAMSLIKRDSIEEVYEYIVGS